LNPAVELDFSDYRALLIALAVILLLAGLGWLGYAYLPAGDKPLTRSEWQVLKASSTYRKELHELQASTETLAELLNGRPDPVRAQLYASRIQRLSSRGQPALAYQREKLSLAAQAVSDWAVGATDHDTARQALEGALQALFPQPSPEETVLPRPVSAGGALLPIVARH
jgi:hypothetical protein